MRFKAVLFDLDGTLLDTLNDIGASVNRALAAEGFPIHALSAYRHFVGEGARLLIERALPEGRRDAATIGRVYELYRRDYRERWCDTTAPYPGIPEALDRLLADGLRLGVLSNKPHDMTRTCVEEALARWPFDVVLGQRDEVARKPDPAGAIEAARGLGVAPAEVLYVGDTGVDMETARAAGMFALGVTWGFRDEDELRRHGAARIIHHPADLVAVARLPREG